MKLVFEFTKTGDLIYISHLDLSRLFLRVLRMSGLRPAYSHGFNPHPKMGFAMPLPLGIHSVCELLEFETEGAPDLGGAVAAGGSRSADRVDAGSVLADASRAGAGSVFTGAAGIGAVVAAVNGRLPDRPDAGSVLTGAAGIGAAVAAVNGRLPEGARVTAWWEKPEEMKKSFASCAAAVTYEFMCEGITGAPALLAAFFERDHVTARKRNKKSGMEEEKEIRSEMLGYRIVKDMRGRMLAEVTLSAAPGRTLGPSAFFGAFCESAGLSKEGLSPVVTRTSILGADGRPLKEWM